VWETLSKTQYINEDLTCGGTNTKNEQEEKFFTPPKSPRRVDHNLEVQINKTTPSRYAHLEVNSYSHALVVEQLMSWISFDSKQFPSSNQFVVRKTHYKKIQLDYIAPGSTNANVDKGLIQKFNSSLNVSHLLLEVTNL
jgi:hypothetical protein